MGVESIDDFFERYAEAGSLCHEFWEVGIKEFLTASIPYLLACIRGKEKAQATARFDDILFLKQIVGLKDSMGVDTKLKTELAHGRYTLALDPLS